MKLRLGDVTSCHVAHIALVMLDPLVSSVDSSEPPSHLLGLIREALGPRPSLIHLLLLLILLIVDCVASSQLVLLD